MKNTKKCKNVYSNQTCKSYKPKYKNDKNFSLFFLKIMEFLDTNNFVGITASSIINVYYSLNNMKNVNNYLVRNEMNGGYISMGTSRLSSLNVYDRKLTISYADLGPGLANLVNPISAATLEQIPAIFITGTESSKIVDNRIIQNVQSEKIIENICKSYLVIESSDIKNGKIIKKI